jgi:hypothetical protein
MDTPWLNMVCELGPGEAPVEPGTSKFVGKETAFVNALREVREALLDLHQEQEG